MLDKGNFIREGVNTKQPISLSLETLSTVVAMQTIAADFESIDGSKAQSGNQESIFKVSIEPSVCAGKLLKGGLDRMK